MCVHHRHQENMHVIFPSQFYPSQFSVGQILFADDISTVDVFLLFLLIAGGGHAA